MEASGGVMEMRGDTEAGAGAAGGRARLKIALGVIKDTAGFEGGGGKNRMFSSA